MNNLTTKTSTAKCSPHITEEDVIDDANISLIDGNIQRNVFNVRNSVTSTTVSNLLITQSCIFVVDVKYNRLLRLKILRCHHDFSLSLDAPLDVGGG